MCQCWCDSSPDTTTVTSHRHRVNRDTDTGDRTWSWTVHIKRKIARHICMVMIGILVTIQMYWSWNQSFYTTNLPQEEEYRFHRSSSSSLTRNHHHHNNHNNNDNQVMWEWRRFHHQNTTYMTTLHDDDNPTAQQRHGTTNNATLPSNNNNNKKLLIAQYDSGTNVLYGTLLNLTSRVNVAYARKYSFDYVILHGLAYRTIFDTTLRIPQPSRATYSKVNLIQRALELNYDYLLILDSDAMMYDFDRNVAELMPDHKMVVAHQVYDFDARQYYNINVGVILFNLRHPKIRRVVWLWNIVCFVQIMIGVSDNDQNPIQRILQIMGARQLIEGNREEFAYNNGTFIKHFKRVNSRSWIDSNMDNRIVEIQDTVREVCTKYSPVCDTESPSP